MIGLDLRGLMDISWMMDDISCMMDVSWIFSCHFKKENVTSCCQLSSLSFPPNKQTKNKPTLYSNHLESDLYTVCCIHNKVRFMFFLFLPLFLLFFPFLIPSISFMV